MIKTKQMFKGLCAMSLAVGIGATALTALPTDADATVFSGSFVVNANTSEPGLRISTFLYDEGKFETPDLNKYESESFNLFQIWTPEDSIGQDGTKEKTITVEFTFTAPPLSEDKIVTGKTDGIISWGPDYGKVTWNAPLWVPYPDGGDGLLKIELSNEEFGLNGRNPATVIATFTNKANPTPAPEPATLAVLGLGLAGLGWAARRRKQAV